MEKIETETIKSKKCSFKYNKIINSKKEQDKIKKMRPYLKKWHRLLPSQKAIGTIYWLE